MSRVTMTLYLWPALKPWSGEKLTARPFLDGLANIWSARAASTTSRVEIQRLRSHLNALATKRGIAPMRCPISAK